MSEQPDTADHARESIKSMTKDPVAKLLLANSQLTLAQLETILASWMSSEIDTKKTYGRFYRPTGRRPTRGAFNRTLIQAQNNVIRSIYTVLLLAYLGLYDSASLQPFIELSDTLQSYIQNARQANQDERVVLGELNIRLLEGISSLAKRKSFKDQT
jgi:hypothetical protein